MKELPIVYTSDRHKQTQQSGIELSHLSLAWVSDSSIWAMWAPSHEEICWLDRLGEAARKGGADPVAD